MSSLVQRVTAVMGLDPKMSFQVFREPSVSMRAIIAASEQDVAADVLDIVIMLPVATSLAVLAAVVAGFEPLLWSFSRCCGAAFLNPAEVD